MSTKIVTLAYPYTDAEGTEHAADDTVELPAGEAGELIAFGRARRVELAGAQMPGENADASNQGEQDADPADLANGTPHDPADPVDPVDPPKEN